MRDHDVAHVPSYQKMFGSTVFANIVQSAATNALTDPEMCGRFTQAMDGFGDMMRNLEDSYYHIGVINGARLNLQRLIDLMPADADRTSPLNPDETVFDYVWKNLSLDRHAERYADYERTARRRGSVAMGGYGGMYYEEEFFEAEPYGYEAMVAPEPYVSAPIILLSRESQ